MKKKLITLVLIIASVGLLYVYNSFINRYYNSSYYNVEITADVSEVLFENTDTGRTINIQLNNNSRRILSSENNVYLAYHLLDSNENLIEYDMPRTSLSKINPFNDSIFPMNISRPSQPGEYIIVIDLVEEGVCWFSDKGNETLVLRTLVQ